MPFQSSIAQCNGFDELCSRKYNEVAYLTTHNAFNCTENNFSLPNQTYSISHQLNDGVRGLMIDVYDVGGVLTAYHGSSYLGSAPLISVLNEIKTFLDSNPNEIISVIFESYTTAEAIAIVMNQAGLLPFLFEKNTSSDWPTLQEMINSNKRLVVFSEKNDTNPNLKWYHYIWNHAVETNFSVNDTAGFTCDYNRGNPANDLFIFNHFITNYLGVGSLTQAQIANTNPFFINRLIECQQFHNKFPNFITVDFYETGQCLDVVNTLNGVVASSHNISNFTYSDIIIWPNPISNEFYIEIPQSFHPPFSYSIYNSSGAHIINNTGNFSNKIIVSTVKVVAGLYSLLLIDNKGNTRTKKIVVQ